MVPAHGRSLMVLMDNEVLVGVLEGVDGSGGRGGCKPVFGIAKVVKDLVLGGALEYRPVAASSGPAVDTGLRDRWQGPRLQKQKSLIQTDAMDFGRFELKMDSLNTLMRFANFF